MSSAYALAGTPSSRQDTIGHSRQAFPYGIRSGKINARRTYRRWPCPPGWQTRGARKRRIPDCAVRSCRSAAARHRASRHARRRPRRWPAPPPCPTRRSGPAADRYRRCPGDTAEFERAAGLHQRVGPKPSMKRPVAAFVAAARQDALRGMPRGSHANAADQARHGAMRAQAHAPPIGQVQRRRHHHAQAGPPFAHQRDIDGDSPLPPMNSFVPSSGSTSQYSPSAPGACDAASSSDTTAMPGQRSRNCPAMASWAATAARVRTDSSALQGSSRAAAASGPCGRSRYPRMQRPAAWAICTMSASLAANSLVGDTEDPVKGPILTKCRLGGRGAVVVISRFTAARACRCGMKLLPFEP